MFPGSDFEPGKNYTKEETYQAMSNHGFRTTVKSVHLFLRVTFMSFKPTSTINILLSSPDPK